MGDGLQSWAMTTGYFLIADLLGFGNIVLNSNEEQISERIEQWCGLVDGVAARKNLQQVQLISDTVFVGADDTPAGADALVRFASALLNEGVRKSLPVRGAICFGPYRWGRLTYGKAVIAAHRLEQAQNWVGVACAAGLPALDAMFVDENLIIYPTPLKSGLVKLMPVVSWDVPRSDELRSYLTREGLVNRAGEAMDWRWAERVNNTVLFGLYQRLIRAKKADPRRFHGMGPTDVLEAMADTVLGSS